MSLRGLAIEVYGAWGNDFTNMFTHFISLGAVVTQIPKTILANYWPSQSVFSVESQIRLTRVPID